MPTPRYVEIALGLQAKLKELGANSLLPSEQKLAKRFGVSRVTIRRALSVLERGGLVSRERGRGTIVSPPKVARHLCPVYSFEEDLRQQGIKYETQVIEYREEQAPPEYVVERLQLPTGASAYVLSLIRIVDDRTVCQEVRYFPPAIGERFDPLLAQDRAVSQILTEIAGASIAVVDWDSEVVPCPIEIGRVIGVTPGVLIVLNTFTQYLENGSALEAGIMAYRVDRVKFTFSSRDLYINRRSGSAFQPRLERREET